MYFHTADLADRTVHFHTADLAGHTVYFHTADLAGRTVRFHTADLADRTVRFHTAVLTDWTVHCPAVALAADPPGCTVRCPVVALAAVPTHCTVRYPVQSALPPELSLLVLSPVSLLLIHLHSSTNSPPNAETSFCAVPLSVSCLYFSYISFLSFTHIMCFRTRYMVLDAHPHHIISGDIVSYLLYNWN